MNGKERYDLLMRLREAHASSQQRTHGSDIFAEAADLIEEVLRERDEIVLKLSTVEGERDRQYAENIAQIAKLAELEGSGDWWQQRYRETREALERHGSRLDTARRLLDELETFEHPDDPGKSIIYSDGYHLIERVGVILGDDGPEAAAREMARAADRQCIIEECRAAIGRHVQFGELPGNGTDKTAERNGLVLAMNILMGMRENASAVEKQFAFDFEQHEEAHTQPARASVDVP
jgi:hypothetical protein